ncbi:MAG: ribose-phosphate diphosphokinase [Clostridiales bacterium]|jgi:ribose-phosphate pyrophosphokinase|nr:ribose-phosphate diphosphokinase [Clostridiales bacterium]
MVLNSLGLIPLRGCEAFVDKVEYYIKFWRNYTGSYKISVNCPRFSTGEAKGLVAESVRGKDIFLFVDPFNYSITYKMYGVVNRMSPDDHFQDTKRILSAIGGQAKRITVIMPMLYEGRQHRKTFRESLDCAYSLQELTRMGVSNIITFDAHDPRVQNAIPLSGFDNMQAKYQMVKALTRQYGDVEFMSSRTVLISPDNGGVDRCLSYSSALNLDIGMFYKRRDAVVVIDGANPIEDHKYIGPDVAGRDAIVVDDMVSSGDSLLDTFRILRGLGAKRNFAFVTFGLFCNGLKKFDDAYEAGLFNRLFVTNLIYNPDELQSKEWASIVDMSKYTAYVVEAINQDASVGAIIDPNKKIGALLASRRSERAAR